MKLNLFGGIKAIGGTFNKIEQGIQVAQLVFRGAKAIQTADLYHQGHSTLQTIEAQVNELDDIIIAQGKLVWEQAVKSFNLIKEKVLLIKKEVEDLISFVRAEAQKEK